MLADTGPSAEMLAIIDELRLESPLWTAELCRRLNSQPDVAYCGLCADYANPRKRARAAAWASKQACLPGLSPAWCLHPPCRRLRLARLQRVLAQMARYEMVATVPRCLIPDPRQARGWDYGTRIWLEGWYFD